MTFEQIRATILGRMQSFTGIEQARIDYQLPTKRFTPPETGMWCRLNINFSDSFMAGMGDVPYTRKPGLIVFQCFDRGFAETIALVRLTDAIEGHFGYWASGELETLESTVINVGLDASVGTPTGTGFYQKNVNVRFRAG
jgi:hypothetical protein